MRTFLMVAAILLVASCMAFAQTYGDQTSGQTSAQGKPASVTGCLSGPNAEGAYMLKTDKGHSIEVGGTDELKNHVGHEVKLTGEWAKSGSQVGENEAAEKSGQMGKETAEGKEAAEGKEGHERHLKVSKIDMVSTSCSAAAK